MTRARRLANAIATLLAGAGIAPIWLLTTRGRKTGQLRTTPVTLVEQEDRRWLVAPYGPVAWVHNARASGEVTVRRGHHAQDYAIREVGPDEAGPVLKRYLSIARATRPYFQASDDAPLEALIAEANHHPVFELTPLSTDRPDDRES